MPTRTWRLLRLKADVGTPDPAWVVDQIDPDSFVTTVGGVAANGPYTITIIPEDTAVPPIINTFDRASGEDNTAIAAGVTQVMAAKILAAAPLADYLRGVSSSAAIIESLSKIDDQPDLRRFKVVTSAPGGASMDFGPDDTFPITERFSIWDTPRQQLSDIEISFRPVDSNGVRVQDNNGLKFDVKVVERIDMAVALAVPGLPVAVTESISDPNHPVGVKVVVPNSGSEGLGVRISNITDPPTPVFDAIQVMIRARRN